MNFTKPFPALSSPSNFRSSTQKLFFWAKLRHGRLLEDGEPGCGLRMCVVINYDYLGLFLGIRLDTLNWLEVLPIHHIDVAKCAALIVPMAAPCHARDCPMLNDLCL